MTSKNCLIIQGKDQQKFICDCKKTYSRKDSLKEHQKICLVSVKQNGNHNGIINGNKNNTIIGDHNIVNINNSVNSNITVFSFSDLSPTYIYDILAKHLTIEIIKRGDIHEFTEIIVEKILKSIDDVYCYTCPDKKNQKFKMHIIKDGKHIELDDKNSKVLRDLLSEPLINVVEIKLKDDQSESAKFSSLNERKNILPKNNIIQLEKIKNIKTEYKEFNKNLCEKLPENNQEYPNILKELIDKSKLYEEAKLNETKERNLIWKKESENLYLKDSVESKYNGKKVYICINSGYILDNRPGANDDFCHKLSNKQIVGIVSPRSGKGRELNQYEVEEINQIKLQDYLP